MAWGSRISFADRARERLRSAVAGPTPPLSRTDLRLSLCGLTAQQPPLRILRARQRRRDRVLRRVAALPDRARLRSRRQDLSSTSNGPSLRDRRFAAHGRTGAAQLVGAPKPFTVHRRADRASVRCRARRQLAAQYLRRGDLAYGLPIVAPGPDGRPAHPGRRAERDLHARSVGPARRPRVDLENRRRHRHGQPFRQCDARRPAQFGRRARRAGLRSRLEVALRCRPRDRLHPSLRDERPRSRQLRSWRYRTRGAGAAAGAVDLAAADRRHEPAVRQRRSPRPGTMQRPSAVSSASPSISAACTTRSPTACKSGRSASTPTARSATTRYRTRRAARRRPDRNFEDHFR